MKNLILTVIVSAITFIVFFRYILRHAVPYSYQEKNRKLEQLKKIALVQKMLNPNTQQIEVHLKLPTLKDYSCVISRVPPPTAAPYMLHLVAINTKIKEERFISEAEAIEQALLLLDEYNDSINNTSLMP